MVVIYFNNSRLILYTKGDITTGGPNLTTDHLVKENPGPKEIGALCHSLLSGTSTDIVLLGEGVEEMLEAVKKEFTVVQAAGGFVHTPEKKALLIFRRGKWDLPKGKLDEGETLEECAVREVEEETGLRQIQLESPLLVTYHTYIEKDVPVLKESHWYLMQAPLQPLNPQTEEDIERCEWTDLYDLNPYLQNTHPSIKDVVERALQTLQF